MNYPQHNPDQSEQDNLSKQEKSDKSKNQQEKQQSGDDSSKKEGLTSSELPDSTNENKGSMGSGQRQDSN